MITSGSQQAIEIAARVLLDRGSPVWVEEPGYGGAHEPLLRAGARLVPVPVDREGLDVAAGVAREPRARAAYLTPSHQYPLGATMTAARRLQALAWAQSSGGLDPRGRLPTASTATATSRSRRCRGLDRDARVVYLGTFSKVLFPALRVGYMAIPADLVSRFAAAVARHDGHLPAGPGADGARRVPPRGPLRARHVRKMRVLYARWSAGAVLVAALQEEFGDRLQLPRRPGRHASRRRLRGRGGRLGLRMAKIAAHQGLWAMPLSSCYLGPPALRGLVLGYGDTETRLIPAGVRHLRAVLESLPRGR